MIHPYLHVPPIEVTVHTVFWFYSDQWGWFTIDDVSEIIGIVEQMMAYSMGLA